MSGKTWTVPSHVFSRDFEGECVILDLVRGEYFGLNAVGTTVWHALSQGETLEGISERITKEYEVSEEVAREDAERVIAELEKCGLVATST